VDEVLAVGDAEFQKKCLGKMGDVAHEGRTVLFVSHNLTAIKNLCRQTLIIKAGKLDFSGETDLAITNYQENIDFQSSQNLVDRSDWVGDGSVKMTKVSFYDEENNQITEALSGSKLRIKLDYQSSINLDNVDFTIGFRSSIGEPLFLCSTSHSKGEYNLDIGEGSIFCEINSLPLTTGTYILHLSLTAGNSNIQWIPQASKINVQTVDYFGTGSDLSVGHSPFLVNSEWFHG
jgi:lipopolysaccharide transport system ATP-binding protein